MRSEVVWLQELGAEQLGLVGGKGARLGELARLEGVEVPPGFCVTTAAFARAVAAIPRFDDRVGRLASADGAEREALSAALRSSIESAPLPPGLTEALGAALATLGSDAAWAVRSSATAEDLPTQSFAGQHDSFLNVRSLADVAQCVRRCWASLFSERAVAYRARHGVDHHAVRMAVVVQRLIVADAAGVAFTADPLTGHRRTTAIEARLGLGEAFVAGHESADLFTVRDGAIVTRRVVRKAQAVRAAPDGGTSAQPVDAAAQEAPSLTDAQVLRLASVGRSLEAHFGRSQDLEWCFSGERLFVVQARPITTLFPIPKAPDDEPHVYLSVGHQQMMTEALTPLGLSLFQLTAGRPMVEAGGRLFVDVARALAAPATRTSTLQLMGRSDPLTADALNTLLARGDFLRTVADSPAGQSPPAPPPPLEPDPALVARLVLQSEASIAALERDIQGKAGAALLDFIAGDLAELKRLLFDPESSRVILAGMQAAWWLGDQLQAWLGERSAVDALSQSVEGNVTSEMGLALLDLADVLRPLPQVVALLERADDGFLDALPAVEGGEAARAAFVGFLARFGMRCVGEIDLARPRWSERPAVLLPLLLGHVRSRAPGEAARRFGRGLEEAATKEVDVLVRLRALPDGAAKAAETKAAIDRLRAFSGYREYPKYALIRRYAVYRRALLEELRRWVAAGVLRSEEDGFFLRFEELREAARTQRVDWSLIDRRREDFRFFRTLQPPRVLTSDGEVLSGAYRRDDVPAGALVGLAVSGGVVEGRARVVVDWADVALEVGDILVTAFADPSCTPQFVAVAGLVTEVGGLMTHGAVIAREYGVPAVVGVEGATRRIRDGQRIRVNGGTGVVELLD